jgi:hypothetical protein
MFTMRVRDPLGSPGVSCVKLPAAIAFTIDSQLLDRLEQSRRALPPNSVKALWKNRASEHTEAQLAPQRALELDAPSARDADADNATIERFATPLESRLRQLVRIEQLYVRSKLALAQR